MLFPKQIALQDVELLRDVHPARRRFSEYPIVRERREEYVVNTIFQSIDQLFEHDTNIYTRPGQYGPYCFLSDQSEIARALEWQEKHKHLIFLRDMLDCSIAIDYNLASQQVYTELGFAEHNAKINRDKTAIESLANACIQVINKVSVFAESDVICAIPPSPDKDWDLPTEIVRLVSRRIGKPDLSASVRFTSAKKSIKSVSLADKWGALEEGNLKVAEESLGKR